MTIRIGHGFDVHAFGGEGPITIAGVKIPYEQGLLAHSDMKLSTILVIIP